MSIKLYKKTSFSSTPLFENLLHTPKPPEGLYVHGILPPLTSKTKLLAVVGSRKYSHYGKKVCETLISSLKGEDVIIISGLALGIDAIAHKAALEAGIPTIAFPGSGIADDALYPRMNFLLGQEILKAGGALISEYEPQTKSRPYMFPERNRIMAGIAGAVLVIECEEASGSLITARLATEYGRDVLTVPGDIFSSTSSGPHFLIRQGATPIRQGDDLKEALGIEKKKENKKGKDLFDTSHEEKILLSLLETPLPKDALIEKSGMTTDECLMFLTLLEIKGYVSEELGLIRKTC
jgi:DNA processing protein